MNTPKLINRYPGLKPFSVEEHPLFQGRDKEIYDLFYLVKAKRQSLLFGKSGIGKTSLLYAGVFKLFEEANIFPLVVRFQNDSDSPLHIIIKQLEPYVNQELLKAHTNYMEEGTTLWQYVRACEFEKKELTLLLVFDQFEEYFIHDKNKRKPCTKEMADLINERLPDNIQRQLRSIPRKERTQAQLDWFQPLDTKLLYLIRSDKLSLVDEMTVQMNAILKSRFHLLPLQREEAAKAISKPASLQLPNLRTKPFTYKEETVNEILDKLANKEGEVECFQLQVLCQHIEREVGIRQQKGQANIVVTPDYLGGKKGIENILNNYYENQINLLINKKDQIKARQLVEEGLIIDGRRIGVDETFLIKNYEITKNLLQQLLDSRLLQVENTRFGKSYEVSHDSLVAPILKSYEKRRMQEENSKIAWRFGLFSLCLLGLALSAAAFALYQFMDKGNILTKYNEIKQETTENYVNEGISNSKKEEYLKALFKFSKALTYSKDSSKIYEQIAELDQKQIIQDIDPSKYDIEELSKAVEDLKYSHLEVGRKGNPEQFEKTEEFYELQLGKNKSDFQLNIEYAQFLALQNKHKKALEYFIFAQKQAKNQQQEIAAYNGYAKSAITLGMLDEAYDRIRKAYTMSWQKLDSPPLYVETLNLMADYHQIASEPMFAYQYYEQALSTLERNDLWNLESEDYLLAYTRTNQGMGHYFLNQRGQQRAEEKLQLALTAVRELVLLDKWKYWPLQASVLTSLGALSADNGKLQEASTYYIEAREILGQMAKRNPQAYDLPYSLVKHKWVEVSLQSPIQNTPQFERKRIEDLKDAQNRIQKFDSLQLPEAEQLEKKIDLLLGKEKLRSRRQ